MKYICLACITLLCFGCMPPKKETTQSLLKEETSMDEFFWEPFGMHIVEQNTDRDRIIYVSADWCLTCVAFERSILLDKEVYEKLKRKKIIAMRADMTRDDMEISSLLQQYQENILPVLIYIPAQGEGVSLAKNISKEDMLRLLGN